MATEPIYKDLNPLYGLNVYGELLYNEDAIRSSIYNILMTPIGTRVFRPDYGSRLLDYVHEPKDEITALKIENFAIQAIEKWEPRIELNVERTFASPVDGGFTINVEYTIRATGNASSFSFSVVE